MAKQEKTAPELEKIASERYGKPVTLSAWGPGDGGFDFTVTADVGTNIIATQTEIDAIAVTMNSEFSLKQET